MRRHVELRVFLKEQRTRIHVSQRVGLAAECAQEHPDAQIAASATEIPRTTAIAFAETSANDHFATARPSDQSLDAHFSHILFVRFCTDAAQECSQSRAIQPMLRRTLPTNTTMGNRSRDRATVVHVTVRVWFSLC